MKKCQKPSAKVAETIFPHHSQMRSSDVVVVVVGTHWNKFGGNNNNCGCVNQVTASPFTSVSACCLRFRFVGQSKKLPRK